jgi:AraC family transcriptional regulator, regulatory protein of adaptative response / methylated-DNA-[protein]-cysteine methyltransferase
MESTSNKMTTKSQATRIRLETAVEGDPRWARVIARDRSADGQFWYSVATTGVYCRPSCPSRAANPRNVGLHGSLAEAKATGFRPCKRCNPDGPSAEIENAAIIAKACRLIEASEEVPSLKGLAQAANLSTSHFHRLFKSVTGLTPKDYAEAHQASRVRDRLAKGHSVTEAMYDAGFNSSGRFYEKSRHMLGMTPTQYRAGGANEDIRFAVGQSSLGAILVASSDKGVASILIGDDPDELVRDLRDRFPKARLDGGDKEYESMVVGVIGFVETPQIGKNLPRDVRGTAFQRRVWQALLVSTTAAVGQGER